MPYQVTIDTRQVEKLSENLKALHKSAFPVAARQTINDLAFDVKKVQLLPTANENFTVRSASMFKNFSRVEKATGFSNLQSESGMLDKGPAKDFHEQEIGGSIRHDTIPLDQARLSQSKAKKVARANYHDQNRRIDPNRRSRNLSKKSQFVADAAYANKHGMLIKWNDIMFSVRTFRKNKTGRPLIRMKALYSTKKSRNVNVEPTHFMKEAGMKSLEKAERFFKRAANQQFKKYFK